MERLTLILKSSGAYMVPAPKGRYVDYTDASKVIKDLRAKLEAAEAREAVLVGALEEAAAHLEAAASVTEDKVHKNWCRERSEKLRQALDNTSDAAKAVRELVEAADHIRLRMMFSSGTPGMLLTRGDMDRLNAALKRLEVSR